MDCELVRFAKRIGKTTSQLTAKDMFNFIRGFQIEKKRSNIYVRKRKQSKICSRNNKK